MEDKCKKDYREKEDSYPPWNFQEKGESWRHDILVGHNKHGRTRKSLKKK
jgi:hypothetical protein